MSNVLKLRSIIFNFDQVLEEVCTLIDICRRLFAWCTMTSTSSMSGVKAHPGLRPQTRRFFLWKQATVYGWNYAHLPSISMVTCIQHSQDTFFSNTPPINSTCSATFAHLHSNHQSIMLHWCPLAKQTVDADTSNVCMADKTPNFITEKKLQTTGKIVSFKLQLQ